MHKVYETTVKTNGYGLRSKPRKEYLCINPKEIDTLGGILALALMKPVWIVPASIDTMQKEMD